MKTLLLTAMCLMLASAAVSSVEMKPEDRMLLEKIIAYVKQNGGGTAYKSADSGSLGWSESGMLAMFYRMYRLTGDTCWLDQLISHADVIFRNARRDSRGHFGWFTRHYSVSTASAEKDASNQGNAELLPAQQVQRDKYRVEKVLGHTWILTVQENGSLAILNRNTGKLEKAPAEGDIPVSEFVFRLSGEPKPGDRFIVRTIAPEATDYVVHDGMLLQLIAYFIETVLSDKKLITEYGLKAKHYLQLIEEALLPKWDERWRDFNNGGGAYLATNLPTHRYPDITLPHNQYLALGQVMFPLYRVTGKKIYRDRLEKMARFFKSNMRLVDEGYVWNYWDPGRSEDAAGSPMRVVEDTSHGAIDVRFAVEAFEMGIVFTREDIDRIASTYSKAVWNQSDDNPLYCRFVDRRRDPEGKSDRIAVYGWQMLARYSPEVERAIQPVYRHDSPSASVASEWLYARYVPAPNR